MTTPKQYIIANWKMHTPPMPAWVQTVAMVCIDDDVQVVVCPPFTRLSAGQMVLTNTPIAMGGQDCHAQEEGAFTGDVSAKMLRQCGCEFVILGHSERREHHGETNEQVKAKAETALEHGLVPVICIGESAQEREGGNTLPVIERQIAESIPQSDEEMVIAYEPIWAIGSGKTPTLEEVAEVHDFIKKQLHKPLPVVYGGSVKPANASEILAIDHVDGVLVGGASLDGESFAGIIKAVG